MARGVVAFLGDHEIVGLTTFVVNLLVSLGIAAGTDYGIFFFGRYQEARQAGEDRETAFYTTYRSVAKVVLASGLTIAGAVFCLSFTRLPFFQPLGVPCALGMLRRGRGGPDAGSGGHCRRRPLRAVRAQAARSTFVDGDGSARRSSGGPRPFSSRQWRSRLIGLLALPGYKPSYNDQKYLPQDIPANRGVCGRRRDIFRSRE